MWTICVIFIITKLHAHFFSGFIFELEANLSTKINEMCEMDLFVLFHSCK